MKPHILSERANFYKGAFPKWPAPRTDDRWLDGVWVLGNNYRSKTGYYGSYPPGLLARVMALFPDAERVLHLFSGSLAPGPYTRFDLLPNAHARPDVQGDAHRLSEHFAPCAFDLIVADPPYSAEDAQHYGTPMIDRRAVLGQCAAVLEPGGHLAWLDTTLPMFAKRDWHLWGLIGIVRSTNHRFRVLSFFERVRQP